MKVKLKNLSGVMTVDPGNNCAFAFWKLYNFTPYPDMIGMIRPRKADYNSLCQLTKYIVNYTRPFKNVLEELQPETVIVEGVQKYGSLTSEVSISTGDVFKLGYLVSGLLLTSADMFISTYETKAPEWKGSMTKEATNARLRRILPVESKLITATDNGKLNEHMLDAVAMGLSCVDDWWKLRKVSKTVVKVLSKPAKGRFKVVRGLNSAVQMIPDMDGGYDE